MEQKEKKNGCLSALIIGLSIIISCSALAFGLSHFRSDSAHVITATGSASVDFEADIIIWRGSFSSVATAYTSQEAYDKIKSDADQVNKYLLNNGLSAEEVVFNSVDIRRTYRDIYDDNGNYVGSEADGYQLTQSVTISSSNIDNVEKISRDISSLLDLGVEFTSESPEYYYSGLDDLKLDLIDKASVNAKDRVIDEVHKHCLLIFGECAVFL